MGKKSGTSEHWKHEPEEHDFPAAADFLSLLLSEEETTAAVDELRKAGTVTRKAKDLMRASGLLLLASDDFEVKKDLKRVAKGDLLSPVLLVRGRVTGGMPLLVADGYHRICASYHLNEDAQIPCRLVDLHGA